MTAVEKLELSLLGLISFDSEELRVKYKERIANAKQIEKQKIIDAYNDGLLSWDNTDDFTGKDYYEHKFKKK